MRQILEYSAHTKPVFELRPNLSGSHFLSYGLDGSIILWETLTGRQLHAFRAEDSRVLPPVVFSPDSTRIVVGGMDGNVTLFDLTNGEETNTHVGHTGHINCIAFSPDGKHMVSGGEDGAMRLWDFDSGLEEIYLESFHSPVTGAVYSPTGAEVLVCLDSCEVFEWDIQRCQKNRSLVVYEQDEMQGLLLSPAGSYALYSGARGGIIDLDDGKEVDWNLDLGAMMTAPRCGIPPNLAFSDDDRLMATGHFQGIVKIWQTRPLRPIRSIETGGTWAYCVAFSPDCSLLMCATDLSMGLFPVNSGDECVWFPETTSTANWVHFLPGGSNLLTAHGDLALDDTRERGVKINGEYLYCDNLVRLWGSD